MTTAWTAIRVGAVALALLLSSSAWAQPVDIKKGGELFATHCAECHSTKEGRNKKGPSLFNIFGKRAGLNADYVYSDALKNSQLSWDAETLSKYMMQPKALVPGGKMKYEGMGNAAERAAVTAYLSDLGKH